jgi:hypothetical protein
MSMSQVRSLVFYTGFAFLVAHELDAVAQEEWRLLPLFDLLRDSTAYIVFVTLHVPLLAGLMWLTAHPSSCVRQRSRLGVDAFLIVHAALHWLMSGEALYTFHSSLSTALIFGGAVAGLLHLLLSVRDTRAKASGRF